MAETTKKSRFGFAAIARFFREFKSEIKKISWPDLPTVIKNTAVVLTISAIVGAFIWLLDLGLQELMKAVM